MSNYVITGGLGGPWRKKKIENILPQPDDRFEIDFAVSVSEQGNTVTTETTFAQLVAAMAAGKEIKGHAVMQVAGNATVYIPLLIGAYNMTSDEITAVQFTSANDFDGPQINVISWVSSSNPTIDFYRLAEAQPGG